MRVLTLIGFVCFLTFNSAAQNGYSISGTVNGSSGPVKGAIVTLTPEGDTNRKYSTATNDGGFYGFYAAPGKYILKATKSENGNIVAIASTKVEVRTGNQESVNLTFARPATIRETVTVSADTSQSLEEVSKTVNVIGGQEMRERADFALPETLRSIPGLRVQQLGGFGRTATIKTRGLRNQDTALLIDGVRIRDASAITGDASPFLSDLTLTSVSKIEVLRGSGSSLYGTNAIGGVVDFRTPMPQPGWHGQVSGAAGGLGLGRFRGNISNRLNDLIGFNAALSRTVYTKGIDGNDSANNTNFQSRIELNPTSNTNISARFFLSDAFVRLNSNPDTFDPLPATNDSIIDARQGVNFVFDADDPDSIQRSDLFNAQVVISHVFSNSLTVQGYYSGLDTKRENDNGPLGVGFQSASTGIFEGSIHTANGHFDWVPNTANRLTAGYEFELEGFGNDGRTPDGVGDFFTRARQSSNTLYVQDLVSLLNGKLQFAGGFRAQFFSLDDPEFSVMNAPYANLTVSDPPAAYTFDGAASYYFESTGTKVRAHVGNGYRVPSLFERFGTFFSTFFGPEFIALGDPGLTAERTIAVDAGFEQKFLDEKLRLSAVYFYTQLIDTIGFGNSVPDIGETPRPFGGYLNQTGGIARGAELSGTFKPTTSMDIFASYTFTNSDQREPQVFGSGVTTTLGIPENQFTVVATQRLGRFWVNFDLLVSDEYLAPILSNSTFDTYVYRFEGNRRADLTAGYTFGFGKNRYSLRVFGTVENMFDHEYFENGFRTVGQNGRVGVSFGF